MRPIQTGMTWLDDATGGIREKSLWIHAAFPGELKTTFASNVAFNVAAAGHRVAYISLDEPSRVIDARFACMGDKPASIDVIACEEEVGFAQVLSLATRAERPSLIVLDGALFLRAEGERPKTLSGHVGWVVEGLRILANEIPMMAPLQIGRDAREKAATAGHYVVGDGSLPDVVFKHADVVTAALVTAAARLDGTVSFACLHNKYGNDCPSSTMRWHRETRRLAA